MSVKKIVCLLLALVCCIPSLAYAARYRCVDIYDGTVSTDGVIFSAGDKITGGRGISLEIIYVDANGKQIDTGKGTIKSVEINGRKCGDWVFSGSSAMVLQIGNLIQGSFAFTMKPAYAAPDSEGYYKIFSDTYSGYIENKESSQGKKVKFSGRITESADGVCYVAVGDDAILAITAGENADIAAAVGDNVQCMGEVTDYALYNGVDVPIITCTEAKKLEYKPLSKDDTGEDVLKMKERMRELGYFLKDSKLSDSYNDTCVERVEMFQKNNSLPVTGIADADTLALLYSDSARSK